jgi:hypothetical protein
MRARIVFSTMIAALAASLAATAALGGSHSAPSATFIGPKGGSTMSKVTFTVKLSNFTIDGADVGKANASGKGHLHFSLDKGKFDYPKYSGPNGKLAQQLGIAGKYSPSVTPSITYAHLPKGKHTITVFLVNNDHSDTGAKASMSFTVR